MADLVWPHLKRRDPALHEGAGQVVSGENLPLVLSILGVLKLDDVPMDVLEFAGVRGSVVPVQLSLGGAKVELRQVEEVPVAGVLDIEPRPEPLADGVRSSDPRENGVAARGDSCSSAGRQLLGGFLVLRVGDHLLLQLEIAGEEVHRGLEAEVSLREGDDAREGGDGIGREMVDLESELVEKASEEFADGQSEAALEVRDEDHPFSSSDNGLELVLGQAALNLGRDPPSSSEPLYLVRSDVRTFPPGAFADLNLEVLNLGLLRGRHLGRVDLQRLCRSSVKEKVNLDPIARFG